MICKDLNLQVRFRTLYSDQKFVSVKGPIMAAPEEERCQWELSSERHFARSWDPDGQEETDEVC